jgi:hypothetical protein
VKYFDSSHLLTVFSQENLKKESKQSLAQASMIFADDDNDVKISFNL